MFSRKAIDSSELRQKAMSLGQPVCDLLMNTMKDLGSREGAFQTLFAACPNSETVIKAALRAAKRANAPIKFAATLNQVDRDGGYTGMTPREFVETVKLEAESIDYNGPIIIAIDHGGPWLKDIQSIEKWPLEQCMEWIKKSFEAAVDAGYDLIHVDPTVDRTLPNGSVIPIERVIERTVELVEHVEHYRRLKGYSPISYEVGTEEVHGGLADLNVFDNFLRGLKKALVAKNLPDVWPIFVVGKVGTDLHTTSFDPQVAQQLVRKAAEYGSFIKGHYSDYVDNPGDYPLSGMGGANVGPEFTEEEYHALKRLTEIEHRLFQVQQIFRLSSLMQNLENAVYRSGRWKKWLHPDELGKDFSELAPERKSWLIKTGCRYVWAQPEVISAREKLYRNLRQNGYQAEEIVYSEIEKAMDKYFRSFNLININERVKKVLEERRYSTK